MSWASAAIAPSHPHQGSRESHRLPGVLLRGEPPLRFLGTDGLLRSRRLRDRGDEGGEPQGTHYLSSLKCFFPSADECRQPQQLHRRRRRVSVGHSGWRKVLEANWPGMRTVHSPTGRGHRICGSRFQSLADARSCPNGLWSLCVTCEHFY